MSLTAEAEITIVGAIDDVFSEFADHRTWADWMPSVFRPLYGPSRRLRRGDRLIVKLGGALPSLITVDRVEASREVCWSGGVPGIMFARHTFFFDAVGPDSTRIRSVEPWTGLVTRVKPLARGILRAAEAGGRAQLVGFDRWFQQRRPARAA
jgi:hypothetical protein